MTKEKPRGFPFATNLELRQRLARAGQVEKRIRRETEELGAEGLPVLGSKRVEALIAKLTKGQDSKKP